MASFHMEQTHKDGPMMGLPKIFLHFMADDGESQQLRYEQVQI